MDSETNPPWSCKTNWSIVNGNLVNSITFESSLSSIDGDDTEDDNGDLNSMAKQPLLLKPKASDSGPCEITSKFLPLFFFFFVASQFMFDKGMSFISVFCLDSEKVKEKEENLGSYF